MLWSVGKVVFFLGVIAALAYGGVMLLEHGSGLRLWIFDMEFTLGPLAAVIGLAVLVLVVWIGLKLVGLLFALFRFLNGDETAVSRYFDRNRERRGYDALSEGLIALAAGEHTLAMARARTAERLLRKPELTTLLTAQAAEASGDTRAATAAWKALLTQEETRFVAVRGLMRQKLAQGDRETALKLAKQAFALKPRHAETQDTLLRLQAEGGDWKGARDTLSEKARSGALPRSVYRRRDALLALQEAKVVFDEGATIEAREAAIEANKLSPDLIPAAVIAARALVEKGDKKSAARVLRKAWEAEPHPDLAAAYAEIEPNETPEARLKRFRKFLSARPEAEESRLTEAELLLAAEDFRAAAAIVAPITTGHPTQRAFAILAAAERGMGASDAQVQEILAKALAAPRGAQWCCEKCGTPHAQWVPICAACAGFDTLSWREPSAAMAANASDSAQIAPLFFAAARPQSALLAIEEAEPVDPPEAKVEAAIIEEAPVQKPRAPIIAPVSPPVIEAEVIANSKESESEDWPEQRPDDILRRAT